MPLLTKSETPTLSAVPTLLDVPVGKFFVRLKSLIQIKFKGWV